MPLKWNNQLHVIHRRIQNNDEPGDVCAEWQAEGETGSIMICIQQLLSLSWVVHAEIPAMKHISRMPKTCEPITLTNENTWPLLLEKGLDDAPDFIRDKKAALDWLHIHIQSNTPHGPALHRYYRETFIYPTGRNSSAGVYTKTDGRRKDMIVLQTHRY